MTASRDAQALQLIILVRLLIRKHLGDLFLIRPGLYGLVPILMVLNVSNLNSKCKTMSYLITIFDFEEPCESLKLCAWCHFGVSRVLV